ncbi:MAG TPA: FAD-dependent oxidoreductase [Candidatus Dormibacteraeota bacterium]|nr:FAD-dependent oxidoreductase [Candidatus Dormibacteraeota bacterium]
MAEMTPAEIEAFPTLTAGQIARIAPFARERDLVDDESLWEAGDRNRPMYVIVRGEVEILSGADHVVTVHNAGAFTGDVDLLSGRPVVVRARARGAARVLELPPARLRSMIQTDAELSEIFLRAFMLRRLALMAQGGGNIVLIGSRHCAGTLALREFLTRNSQPHGYLDLEGDPAVQETLDKFGVGVDDVPVLICRGTRVLRKPTIEDVADCLGLNDLNEAVVRDVAVIGAGPAGLSTAVYAASEGLDVLVLEARSPGGQAGSSSRIENYLGFPTGVTGQILASSALVQAEKFGAELAVARTVSRLGCDRPYRVELGAGVVVQARSIVIATGAKYRKPDLPNLSRFEGVGVYYGATQVEALFCRGEDVIVIGGGNSAGQAAVFLSETGRHVTMMVRGAGLAQSMSRYLIHRIQETPKITLLTNTRIVALAGDSRLEKVTWRDGNGTETTADIRHVFMMTGADPNTAWLQDCVALDDRGYVKTGPDLDAGALAAARWPFARPPMLFETSRPGVFAIGDVRANSVKRVAAAVGEGSVCVQLVHKVLSESVA